MTKKLGVLEYECHFRPFYDGKYDTSALYTKWITQSLLSTIRISCFSSSKGFIGNVDLVEDGVFTLKKQCLHSILLPHLSIRSAVYLDFEWLMVILVRRHHDVPAKWYNASTRNSTFEIRRAKCYFQQRLDSTHTAVVLPQIQQWTRQCTAYLLRTLRSHVSSWRSFIITNIYLEREVENKTETRMVSHV